MTQDAIALTPVMPDIRTLLAALYAGGPDLRVNRAAGGAVAQLCTDDGQVLVSLEAPRFLQVPGEVARLLGPWTAADAPVWWTEARATTASGEAGRLAGAMAGRLSAVLGGTVWPPEAARTDIVSVPPRTGAVVPGGVDVCTERTLVVIQDRPVVAATAWLTDLMRTSVATGRELGVVTPPDTRLTMAARGLLDRGPFRWVVSDPGCGYYDGLTGVVLGWVDGRFVPAAGPDGEPCVADAFHTRPGAGDGARLALSIRTLRPADGQLVLGGALEHVCRVLTGAPPAGWSTAEPVNVPWSPRQLTDLARSRARRSLPTWFAAVGGPGRPLAATVRVAHTAAGIEERITVTVPHQAGHPPPVETLAEVAGTLARRHDLATMVTELRAGRTDLTTPARWEPPPVPCSVTLGPAAVAAAGAARLRRALPDVVPDPLGPPRAPALHYPLGDTAPAEAWRRLGRLRDVLGGPPGTG
ncbi:DUF6177 family protein [Streptomyces uncialis]|uniref:DUF6177 family protein n=1 Tax=Streptomyces uncialis TaxID=1048205 RepID=UPI00386684A3|nr:DUF6177 family protein [Streptomyces uncialis]